MTHTACEHKGLRTCDKNCMWSSMSLLPCYGNQTIADFAKNPLYHERTKHTEVHCHFIRKVIMKCEVCFIY